VTDTLPTAYDELIDFLAAGTTPASLVAFEPSNRVKDQIADLVRKQKAGTLTPTEAADLDNTLRLEHILRMAKAKARRLLPAG
jgi:hypothetical protein